MRRNKKRETKLVLLILAMCLLVGVAIGGTMAWLIAQTDPVVNTFVVGNIEIELDESDDLNLKMVPGAVIQKDPTVTVKKDSEDCWLFVEIKEENTANFLTYEMADGWTKIGAGTNGGTVYGQKVENVTANKSFTVLKDNEVKVLDTVTKAMMDAIKNGTANEPKLTFTAYAIQSANLKKGGAEVTTAADAWYVYCNQPTPTP